MPSDPSDVVRPETPLEEAICADPAWRAGVAWGEPRSGHPEGTVIAHVADVLANVERVATGAGRPRAAAAGGDRPRRVQARGRPIAAEDGIENHHAMRARRFAERHLADADLLDVIELHDDAYLAWRHGRRTGDWAEAERRARALLDRLGDRFGLFMRFYRADNETGGKTDEHRHWFAGLRDGLRLETARLTLVAAPAELLRALCDGDTGRAEGLLGAALPAGWPDYELAGHPARIARAARRQIRRRSATACGSQSAATRASWWGRRASSRHRTTARSSSDTASTPTTAAPATPPRRRRRSCGGAGPARASVRVTAECDSEIRRRSGCSRRPGCAGATRAAECVNWVSPA